MTMSGTDERGNIEGLDADPNDGVVTIGDAIGNIVNPDLAQEEKADSTEEKPQDGTP
jgi:hypothetical protein